MKYKQYLSEHYRATSANPMPAAIDSFFDYLGWTECKVRLFKIQQVQPCEPERELTEKDCERLIQTAERKDDARVNMLLQIISSTGIRVSELRSTTVESLETDQANVYNKGKSRVALFPMKLMKVLKKYYRKMGVGRGGIFVTRNGKPMDRSNVSKEMKELE